MSIKKKQKRAVVVTTEYRGVFFGYVENDKSLPNKIVLSNARHCVYWDKAVHGVLGLASVGPSYACRIGFLVPLFTAWKITSVTDCTAKAIQKWEAGPWS